MMKKIIILVLFLLIINGISAKKQVYDDGNVYLSANPDLLTDINDRVLFNLSSRNLQGNFNYLVGMPDLRTVPKGYQYFVIDNQSVSGEWIPYWYIWNISISKNQYYTLEFNYVTNPLKPLRHSKYVYGGKAVSQTIAQMISNHQVLDPWINSSFNYQYLFNVSCGGWNDGSDIRVNLDGNTKFNFSAFGTSYKDLRIVNESGVFRDYFIENGTIATSTLQLSFNSSCVVGINQTYYILGSNAAVNDATNGLNVYGAFYKGGYALINTTMWNYSWPNSNCSVTDDANGLFIKCDVPTDLERITGVNSYKQFPITSYLYTRFEEIQNQGGNYYHRGSAGFMPLSWINQNQNNWTGFWFPNFATPTSYLASYNQSTFENLVNFGNDFYRRSTPNSGFFTLTLYRGNYTTIGQKSNVSLRVKNDTGYQISAILTDVGLNTQPMSCGVGFKSGIVKTIHDLNITYMYCGYDNITEYIITYGAGQNLINPSFTGFSNNATNQMELTGHDVKITLNIQNGSVYATDKCWFTFNNVKSSDVKAAVNGTNELIFYGVNESNALQGNYTLVGFMNESYTGTSEFNTTSNSLLGWVFFYTTTTTTTTTSTLVPYVQGVSCEDDAPGDAMALAGITLNVSFVAAKTQFNLDSAYAYDTSLSYNLTTPIPAVNGANSMLFYTHPDDAFIEMNISYNCCVNDTQQNQVCDGGVDWIYIYTTTTSTSTSTTTTSTSTTLPGVTTTSTTIEGATTTTIGVTTTTQPENCALSIDLQSSNMEFCINNETNCYTYKCLDAGDDYYMFLKYQEYEFDPTGDNIYNMIERIAYSAIYLVIPFLIVFIILMILLTWTRR